MIPGAGFFYKIRRCEGIDLGESRVMLHCWVFFGFNISVPSGND